MTTILKTIDNVFLLGLAIEGLFVKNPELDISQASIAFPLFRFGTETFNTPPDISLRNWAKITATLL